MQSLPEFGLGGRVVAVTGAGRGIGRAIALDAARSGARVSACSRTLPELQSLEADIEQLGGECAISTVDLSTTGGPAAFVDQTARVFGRIDALVNNAGTNVLKDAIDYTDAEIDNLLTLNLKSVYVACVAAARTMIDRKDGGSIVNITSQAGLVGAPGRAPYSAAKAGVNNLTRSLAAEWGVHGIRVNAVAPTVTLTPLGHQAMEERPALQDEIRAHVLLGRAADVHEISAPVVFLLSDAAAMITGHVLAVDGGWTAT